MSDTDPKKVQALLKRKNEKIKELEKELVSMKKNLDNNESKYQEFYEKISELEKQNNDKDMQIQKLVSAKTQDAQIDAIIENLQLKISELEKNKNNNDPTPQKPVESNSQIEELLYQMGQNLQQGNITCQPLDPVGGDACGYCGYRSVCPLNGEGNHRQVPPLTAEQEKELLQGGDYHELSHSDTEKSH